MRDTTRSATVRAAEDVALFRIEQADFRELVDSIPQLRSYVDKFMHDSALRDFLRTSTFLESLKPTEIAALLDQLTEREFAAGTTILQEGDTADCMFIVRSGQLKVERHVNGAAQFVRYLREGEYFGEWALMTDQARSATVTALTDTRCFSLSRDHFDAMLNSAPKLRDQLTERFRRYQLDDQLPGSHLPHPDIASRSSKRLAGINEITTEIRPSQNVDDTKRSDEPADAFIPDEWKHAVARSWTWKRKRPRGLWQHTESDCGPTALAMVALSYRAQLSVSRMCALARVGRSGTSLYELAKTAEAIGFETHAIRTSRLDVVALPAIAHYGGQHYVTVFSVSETKVLVGDPARGLLKIDRAEFNSNWSGHLLLLRPTVALRKTEQQESVRDRLKGSLLSEKYALKILALSVLLYLIALFGPWAVGAFIDGTAGWIDQVGLTLFAMWPILSLLRFKQTSEMWNQSPIASNQLVLRNLVQAPVGSPSVPARLTRLLQARDVLEHVITGRPLAAALNAHSAELMLLLVFLIDMKLGVIAFIGSYVAIRMVKYEVAKNAQRIVAGVTSSVAADAQLLDKVQHLELIQVTNGELNDFPRRLAAPTQYDHTYELGLCALTLTGIVMLYLGLGFVAAKEMTAGGFVAAMLYFAFGSYRWLMWAHTKAIWTLQRSTFEPLWQGDWTLPVRVATPERSIASPTIVLENVDYSYETALPNTLTGISLRIKPGQNVAIVGRSGSGKSSLLRLVRGAVVPTSGRVLFDGVDCHEIDSYQLHRTFGIALQHDSLLAGSIRENIALFDSAASLDRIKDAALRVGAHEFIESLPLGYETPVGAIGYPLPVEQVQRICLARSILHEPPVLVWDEATAAMDLDSERRLFSKLEPWLADRTLIMATRRLHTVQNADLIVVLSHGSIVEQGTHPQLIEARGLYYYLCCQHAMVYTERW